MYKSGCIISKFLKGLGDGTILFQDEIETKEKEIA
jgi:hypothetical protein